MVLFHIVSYICLTLFRFQNFTYTHILHTQYNYSLQKRVKNQIFSDISQWFFYTPVIAVVHPECMYSFSPCNLVFSGVNVWDSIMNMYLVYISVVKTLFQGRCAGPKYAVVVITTAFSDVGRRRHYVWGMTRKKIK